MPVPDPSSQTDIWGNILGSPDLIGTVLKFILGGGFLSFLGWLALNFQKLRYKFFPGKLDVVFAIHAPGEQAVKYKEDLRRGFSDCIDAFQLRRTFSVKDLSKLIHFDNAVEAEKYCKEHDVSLVVWGDFLEDGHQVSGEDVSEFVPHFTFLYPDDAKGRVGAMMLLDIQSRFARLNYWRILKKESLTDVKILTNKLFEQSCYVLALALKAQGRMRDSLALFEKLYSRLTKNDPQLAASVFPHLVNCHIILGLNAFQKKKYGESLFHAKTILSLQHRDSTGLALLAVSSYFLDDSATSWICIKKLKQYYPTSNLPSVDEGFLLLLDGKFDDAYHSYWKVYQKDVPDFNPFEVICFLDEEFQKTKNYALKYGIGVISHYYGDRKLARKELRIFCIKFRDIPGASKLVKHAKKLIEK